MGLVWRPTDVVQETTKSMASEVSVGTDVILITAMTNLSLVVSARITTVVRITTEIAETVVLVTDVTEIDLFGIGLNPFGEVFRWGMFQD